MLHYFNVEIAAKYGMKDAVVLQSLAYWLKKNVDNKKNIHDGMAWTYNSVEKMLEYFPYLTYSQLADSLRRLEKNGLIVASNYNKRGYDRTKWYTLTTVGEGLTGVAVRCSGGDFGQSKAARGARFREKQEQLAEIKQAVAENELVIVENSTMEDGNFHNGGYENQQPIPIIETVKATVSVTNACTDEVTHTEAKEVVQQVNVKQVILDADSTIALGIWKRYIPKVEPDRPDVLGKLYRFLGTYKFTNLVEEAAVEGISDMLELGNLLGEMQRNGDILTTRAMRLERRNRKPLDWVDK